MNAMNKLWNSVMKKSSPMPVIALERIKKELRMLHLEPIVGIEAVPEEEDMSKVHALIIGPKETPYEGGFFYFLIRFTNEYPMRPPIVTLMTTGNNCVRFNPNLYACGKVCVSILNTWIGTPWSPALTISTLLLTIQSMLNEAPFHNEPGYEKSTKTNNNNRHRFEKEAKTYNDIVLHETIRVAVCDMLEDSNRDSRHCPQELKKIMNDYFVANYSYYENVVVSNAQLNGIQMIDPFGDRRPTFRFDHLLKRLHSLRDKFEISC